jgi:hypothetical protein
MNLNLCYDLIRVSAPTAFGSMSVRRKSVCISKGSKQGWKDAKGKIF